MESLETKLARIEEKQESMRLQLARLISHFESEQRVYNGHGKRLDLVDKLFERLDLDVKECRKILFDGVVGLAVRMDRIEQREQGSKNRITIWISIISLLLSLAIFLMNMKAA